MKRSYHYFVLCLFLACAGPSITVLPDDPALVRTFEGHSDWVNSVAFSPDGRYALSGSGDKTLKLWEISTGKLVRTFEGHSKWLAFVSSVAFSPGGSYALSGSWDNTLKLWDVSAWIKPVEKPLVKAKTTLEPKPSQKPAEESLVLPPARTETPPPAEVSPPASKPALAILDFEGVGVSEQDAQILTTRLGTYLVQTSLYRVIEREEVQQILVEQDFQLTGCTTNECAVEIGQLVGARQMLAGTFGKLGSTYTIDMRIIDVETGSILRTTSFDIRGEIDRVLSEGLTEAVRRIIGSN